MIKTKLAAVNMERAHAAIIAAGGAVIGYYKGSDHIEFTIAGKRGMIYTDGRLAQDADGIFQKAYAAQTIRDAAKRFGWRTAETKTTTGTQQLKLSR